MTDVMQPRCSSKPIAGRSLWGDAWARLKANRAAMVEPRSISSLDGARLRLRAVVRAASIHDHLSATMCARRPASRAYPQADMIADARSTEVGASACASTSRSGIRTATGLRHRSPSTKPIDERNIRYLDRSDTFDDAKVESKSRDGLQLVMSASIKQQYFLFGTDNTGRDLLSRTLDGRPHLAGHRPARRPSSRWSSAWSTAPLPAFSAARSTRS